VSISDTRNDYPFFQVWRPASSGSTVYNKIDEVQLQSDSQVTRESNNSDTGKANILLTGNDRLEFQSGDVVGYFHPTTARYQVKSILTNRYAEYLFIGSTAPASVNLINADHNYIQEPLIHFEIGEFFTSCCVTSYR